MLRPSASSTASAKSAPPPSPTPANQPSAQANKPVLLSHGERKLMQEIIKEREERVKETSDLTSELQSLRRELSSLRRAPAPAPSQDSKGNVDGPELLKAVEYQRKALEAQREVFEKQTAQFNKSLEDLRSAQQKADLAHQEGLSKSMASAFKLRADLDELKVKGSPASYGSVPVSPKSPGKAKPGSEQPDSEEGSINSVPMTNAWMGKKEEAKRLQSGKFDPEGYRALVRHVRGLEEQLSYQGKEVVSIRTVLIEVHVNSLLNAMRANRVALHATELSREERRFALASLDVKERQIREDVDAFREKIEICPEVALLEIAKVTLEQTF